MRKTALLIITALILASCLFADVTTDSATLNVAAYKETPIPAMNYTITIKDFNNANLTGVTSVLDISNNIKTSRTLNGAFEITIKSNLKIAIPIVIEFTPLINQEDTAATPIPVTYTMTKGALTEIQGSSQVRVNNDTVVTNGGKYYYYAYTPAIALTNNATTVNVDESGAITTLTHSVGSVRRKRTTIGSSFTGSSVPSTSANVLPGLGNNQVLTSSATFNLVVSDNDYNNMPANVDHVATVKLTITPL